MEDFLRVGIISSTHGVRGEVKVYPTTDDIKRFDHLKEVILDTGKENIDLEVENVKYFKNMVILKFKGINSINDIEKYKNMDLLVTRDNAVELEEDEYFITDIIGFKVVTEEEIVLGHLSQVLVTGANDVYLVKTEEGKEILLPAIRQCILDIDLESKIIKVHLMDGLI